MTRILGAVLTAGVCAWIGDRRARQLKCRVDTLDSLITALRGMERELADCLTPLPRLVERMTDCTTTPVRSLFQGAKRALERLEEEEFSAAWGRMAQEIPDLEREDRRIVCSLGGVLGRYDGGRQGEAVARACRELERNREQADQDFRRLGRVYRTVGAVCGGFLLILLL